MSKIDILFFFCEIYNFLVLSFSIEQNESNLEWRFEDFKKWRIYVLVNHIDFSYDVDENFCQGKFLYFVFSCMSYHSLELC